MSPLAPTGTRGYTDWQRVSNYDSDPIWQTFGPATVGGIQSGIQDVSRFAYLGGSIQCSTQAVVVQCTWYADAAGTEQIGTRSFTLSAAVGGFANLRLPNLGPFINVFILSATGANANVDVLLLGTNRVHPLEFIPARPLLINQQAVPIAASATLTVFPQDYYAGPAQWWVDNPTGVTALLRFSVLDITGTTVLFHQAQIAASGDTSGNVVLPPGSWSVAIITNPTGNGNYYLTVRHPVTGAT